MKRKIILLIIIVLFIIGLIFLLKNGNDTNYNIEFDSVDEFTTDVYLTVYKDSKKILIDHLEYIDGQEIISYINRQNYKITVNKNDIENEEEIIVVLPNNLKKKIKIK